MKPNCDLCKVSSTSSSPPLPPTARSMGKTKVGLEVDDDHHDGVKSAKNKYLSHPKNHSKHCSSADSPPLKPVSNLLAGEPPPSAIRTIAPESAEVAAVAGHQQQQSAAYHHLHHHRQFNGFDEYYSAPLLSPSLMMDMMLAAHLLRG